MARALKSVLVAGFAAMAAADAVQAWIVWIEHGDLTRGLAAVYELLFAILVWTFGIAVIRRPRARATAKQPLAVAACTAALLSAVALAKPGGGSAALAVVGELIAVSACIWLVVSALALGKCFGILPAARGLVTRGPYRLVRHPLYLGELGVYSGLLIASPSVLAAAGGIVLLGAQWIRLGFEERVLASEFAADYGAYAARTPRLVPRLPGAARIPRPRSLTRAPRAA